MTGSRKRLGAVVLSLVALFATAAPVVYTPPPAVQWCMNQVIKQAGGYGVSPLGCVWQDIQFGGRRTVENRNQTFSGWAWWDTLSGWPYGPWDNQISSLYNNTGQYQYYYDGTNRTGARLPVSQYGWISDLRSTNYGNWNDRISSVMVYNTPW